MEKYYVLRFWCKKQKLVHFGLVLVQTRTVPAYTRCLKFNKLCGEHEFEKKIKKIKTLFLDREDFTDNDTKEAFFLRFGFHSPDFADSKSAIKNHLSFKETEIF